MNNLISVSKFLSFVLRHKPDKIGLTLDSEGWANVDDLIECCNKKSEFITIELIEKVVATNDKKRFAFNADKTKIRANQGHSLQVDLHLTPKKPPELLYHGTATRFLNSIKAQGLISGNRQYVHLSSDMETAIKVGKRHGNPIVLTIRAWQMFESNMIFYISENGVWLTNQVPTKYIELSITHAYLQSSVSYLKNNAVKKARA